MIKTKKVITAFILGAMMIASSVSASALTAEEAGRQVAQDILDGKNGGFYIVDTYEDDSITDTNAAEIGRQVAEDILDGKGGGFYVVETDGVSDENYSSEMALMILRHSIGLETLDDELIEISDINEDGLITSADALSFLRLSVR